MRAILLASATAASFFELRASNASSHGEVRSGLAARITAVAPMTSKRRKSWSPARLILPSFGRPAVEFSRGVIPTTAAALRRLRSQLQLLRQLSRLWLWLAAQRVSAANFGKTFLHSCTTFNAKLLAKRVSAREEGCGVPRSSGSRSCGRGMVRAADKHQTEADLPIRICW